jgi:energy-coupling factor transporter ATP-binding protein EcfA2
MEKNDIKQAFDRSEKIGVIGSPSSTGGLTIDVLGTAIEKRLVGHLSIFHFKQDQSDHYALGQITEITMQNPWTQDPTMRGIIRRRERVDPVTEKQDIHTANMIVSSVFSYNERIGPSILGTVPPTGTSIRLLNEDMLQTILEPFKSETFFLGNAYGTQIKMPMWLKHFGKEEGGIGEAYHIGVFGKTGSGKSILAKMMMLGYARHKQMNILVIDPQGDFTKDFKLYPNIEKQYKQLNKDIKIYHISNLVLDDPVLFVKILAKSKFWEGLVRSYDYRVRAGEILLEFIDKWKERSSQRDATIENFESTKSPKITRKYEKSIFNFFDENFFKDIVWTILNQDAFQKRVYSKTYAQEYDSYIKNSTYEEFYRRWLPVAKLFTWVNRDKHTLTINRLISDQIFNQTGSSRPFVIIDLSKETLDPTIFWNDEIQMLTIKRILDKLTEVAEKQYKNNTLLNSLVVIDEAHRFAPREKIEDESLNEVKTTLIDAIRTTRKYGLGWMFISQTLSSLDKDIINQIRIFLFGFGLAWGVERQALREIIGGAEESFKLYQMFKDPQSSLGEREYSFMTVGPISPLSFSGTPLFFTSLKYPEEFLKINFEGTNRNE